MWQKSSLGGLNWKDIFLNYNGNFQDLNLDSIAMSHIKKFWSRYNLELGYSIEHKDDHFSIKTCYWGKGNYALKTYNFVTRQWDKIIFKIRGQKEISNGILNPGFQTFKNILDGEEKIPEILNYKHESLLKVTKWRSFFKKNPNFTIKPGELIISDRKLKYNNKHMPCNYKNTYNSKEKLFTKTEYDPYTPLGQESFSKMHYEMMQENIHLNEKQEKKQKNTGSK